MIQKKVVTALWGNDRKVLDIYIATPRILLHARTCTMYNERRDAEPPGSRGVITPFAFVKYSLAPCQSCACTRWH